MKKIVKKLIDKQTLFFIIGGLIINALCFFIYALPVKAATIEDFDNYYPIHQNQLGFISSNELNFIDNYFDAENNYIFAYWSFDWEGYDCISVCYTPKDLGGCFYGELKTDITYFGLYTIGSVNWKCYLLGYKSDSDYFVNVMQNNTEFLNLNYGWNYISNFKLYTNNNVTTQKLILNYGAGPVIQTGHATPPDEFDNPLTSNNQTLPREVPQAPTYNSYTWNTYNPPAFDNSSVLNAIESLGDKIEYAYIYLKDGIHGEIYTLTGNIKAYFEYIGETIQYYGGLIIDNIQNLITTFYNNMVSLVEDIAGKITEFKETLTTIYNFISTPLDTSVLNTQLNNSTFIGAIRTTKTQISSFYGMFSNISQPENVIFEIDLSGVWFDGGVSYLDFSILTPVLPFIRLVLGSMLLYDLIVTLFTNINSYIGGNSAKNDGG